MLNGVELYLINQSHCVTPARAAAEGTRIELI